LRCSPPHRFRERYWLKAPTQQLPRAPNWPRDALAIWGLQRPKSVGMSTERLARLDAAMKRLADDKQVAGLVTLVERHGKIVHFNAAGQLDVRKPDPLQKDSIFRIYSMTKPVTGVAMMMLYEEGKWQLNDPVSRYVPEFARLKVYLGKNEDGSPKVEDARRSMTMRELMTHTGGLGYILNPNNPVDKMIIDANVLNATAPLQAMIDGLAKNATARAARHALVLQHRRRRPGLPGREIVRSAVRRIPAYANL